MINVTIWWSRLAKPGVLASSAKHARSQDYPHEHTPAWVASCFHILVKKSLSSNSRQQQVEVNDPYADRRAAAIESKCFLSKKFRRGRGEEDKTNSVCEHVAQTNDFIITRTSTRKSVKFIIIFK